MKREFKTDSLSDIRKVATVLLKILNEENYKIVEFYGSMGAGKTTLIRELCIQMGVEDVVTSPTFAIINEYRISDSDNMCYHFDFYRINKIEEVYDMGYEEYFYSGNLCLIEWPEMIEELLPTEEEGVKTLRVNIEQLSEDDRKITF